MRSAAEYLRSTGWSRLGSGWAQPDQMLSVLQCPCCPGQLGRPACQVRQEVAPGSGRPRRGGPSTEHPTLLRCFSPPLDEECVHEWARSKNCMFRKVS